VGVIFFLHFLREKIAPRPLWETVLVDNLGYLLGEIANKANESLPKGKERIIDLELKLYYNMKNLCLIK